MISHMLKVDELKEAIEVEAPGAANEWDEDEFTRSMEQELEDSPPLQRHIKKETEQPLVEKIKHEAENPNELVSDWVSNDKMKRETIRVKVLCFFDFLFSGYGLFVRGWYVSFGIIFAPIGFIGAHKLNWKFTFAYLFYLLFQLLVELYYLFRLVSGLEVTFALLVMAIQSVTLYYTYVFYCHLPNQVIVALENRYMEPRNVTST